MLPFVHCTHFGPLCRSVEDAALVLDITKGYHPADPVGLYALVARLGSKSASHLSR